MESHGEHSLLAENISGTTSVADLHANVTADGLDINQRGSSQAERCGYVVASDWRYGAGSPFCDAPTARGSSYCARHRAVCVVPPGGGEAARVIAAQARVSDQAPLPPDLARLNPVDAPEVLAEDAGEALAALRLPRADRRGDEE